MTSADDQISQLTINQAAAITGWSARMLRYIEELGLVVAPRSNAGYRLYGAGELQRLRTLRELLTEHDISLTELGFAMRLRRELGTCAAVDAWIDAPADPPNELVESAQSVTAIDASQWLRFEQEKHQRLLAAVPVAAAVGSFEPQRARGAPSSRKMSSKTSKDSQQSVKESA